MECLTRIASSIVIIECPLKTRSDLATAMNIQPTIQGGEVCMGTATTLALLTTIWGLHIGVGKDCGLHQTGEPEQQDQSLGMAPLIPPKWVSASARWIWKADFAMSRPIVVTSMTSSSSSGSLNSSYIHGTHVRAEEPPTASETDMRFCQSRCLAS